MPPAIIRRDLLRITGLSGDGRHTGDLWHRFDKAWNDHPWSRVDECGYEIRFYCKNRPVPAGRDVHVGFASRDAGAAPEMETVALPASEYAVFEVRVAEGYDSQNKAMDDWLAANPQGYRARLLDGVGYVVECYGDKFKDGSQPDSRVDIWVPVIQAEKS